jgi:putative ABC transport system substrate-binding protein
MERRACVAGTLALLTAPLVAGAQPARRTASIGYLGNSSSSLESNLVEALRDGLRQLGYVEGRNLIITYQFAEGQQERLAGLARELVRLKPEVIVTAGTPGTLAAQQATQTIPIVAAVLGDPVTTGVVASLAKPGGNVTGLANFGAEFEAKRFELLKQTFRSCHARPSFSIQPIPSPRSAGKAFSGQPGRWA